MEDNWIYWLWNQSLVWNVIFENDGHLIRYDQTDFMKPALTKPSLEHWPGFCLMGLPASQLSKEGQEPQDILGALGREDFTQVCSTAGKKW